ncbi:TetR/AcrR family transcriptional regulator [Streptomyces sp. NPDC045251]|uniref:TetR/AcrR family transcriptional regulator n=1 Tax=unclassified Streptomyces TaxID=2593676 RepID=UPI0033FF3AA8
MSRPLPATPRRADARQNVEKILDAAIDCLSRNSEASVVQIARAAGVGRVTLYGHFPSRDSLVEAALARLLAQGDEVLAGLDLSGDPRAALEAFIQSSWLLTAQSSAVLEAAQAVLPRARIHALHARPEQRVRDLIVRGQNEGVFRTDLPADWLASALHHLLKGTAADVANGTLAPDDAPRFLAQMALAAYTPVPAT